MLRVASEERPLRSSDTTLVSSKIMELSSGPSAEIGGFSDLSFPLRNRVVQPKARKQRGHAASEPQPRRCRGWVLILSGLAQDQPRFLLQAAAMVLCTTAQGLLDRFIQVAHQKMSHRSNAPPLTGQRACF
jgi:hypothetical protein